MPELNKDTIGKEYKPAEVDVKQRDSIYYALATNDPNPYYINGSREGGVICPPMYAVAYGGLAIGNIFFDPEVGKDFMMQLVHGEQEIEWFRAARPGMKMSSTCKLVNIEDKGSGELITAEVATNLADSGEKICRQTYKFFVRGYGKLEKGPKTPEPEEDKSDVAFESTEHVLLGQSYAYAEPSGDHNPIHVNEDFANKVGLGGIILQGLCSMAFCHKAAVQGLCGGNPLKLKKFSVRFSKPVRPEDEITIKSWWIEKDKVAGFEATTQNGDAVIKNGRAELGEVAE